ncbi:MAG: V-type ATP synthase subunit E family protein, partial [Syntrophomonadaceae bacterium]
MKTFGSVASLVEAVHEEVEAESARIRRDAEETERREGDAAARERIELPGRAERLAEERRKASELLAREDWADRRETLERREAFVAEAARRGLERLASGPAPSDRAEALGRLVREAIERMPGEVVEIAVNEADAPLLTEAFRAELARRAGRREARLPAERLETAGGCVVRTEDGRTSFDNTFEARARRFETAWRAAV